ncbi:MAG: heavy metal translocating P-type ATPase [Candidatus Uhrbacteria bacterium]|nr:heavy metal translocating P-type ATPase [Candidatus Uhrbacteria bacterium]
MKNETLRIADMHCASCAVSIEKDLKSHPGVASASVNFATGKATIAYDEAATTPSKLMHVITKAGYTPLTEGKTDHHEHHHASPQRFWVTISAFVIAIPLFVSMFWMPSLGTFYGYELTQVIMAISAWMLVIGFGWTFHAGTCKALLHARATMDTLVTIGTGSALAWSTYAFFTGGHMYFEVAGFIITFLLLGRYLEERQRSQAGSAIQELLRLHAKLAHRLDHQGQTSDVDVETLRPGDECLVKSGEQIPIDGIVIQGHTTIDESMLTGEPIPVERAKGDAVIGGTINGKGSITMRVTAEPGKTVLDTIIATVEHTFSVKSPIEKLLDRVSAIFVPVVIGTAIITGIAWLFVSHDPGTAMRIAVAVLIVACPCAMGLATPAAIMVGAGSGAKKGILIRDGSALEEAHRINTIIFDKTGTLTRGKPTVTDIVECKDHGVQPIEILTTAAALEASSEHPLAGAVLAYAQQHLTKTDTKDLRVERFEAIPGKGIRGILHGSPIFLGTEALMQEQGITIPQEITTEISRLRHDAKTIVFVARDTILLGAIAAQDQMKKDAKDAITQLVDAGYTVGIITGDHAATANAAARTLGITLAYADASPIRKADIIKELQRSGKHVAFVGDGMNDAPALAAADLGIAIGTGTDIAIASGQIVIMNGAPTSVVDAMKLSKNIFKTIKQNLFWAFAYNVIGIPLAAFGLLNPVLASAAMAMSSVSVLGNSLRMKRT